MTLDGLLVLQERIKNVIHFVEVRCATE